MTGRSAQSNHVVTTLLDDHIACHRYLHRAGVVASVDGYDAARRTGFEIHHGNTVGHGYQESARHDRSATEGVG